MKAEPDATGLPPGVSENIDTIAAFYAQHEERKTLPQTIIERFSLIVGSPGYVVASLMFIIGWIAYNLLADEPIDDPPFFWLQGIVALNAFLISTTVLIRQNRVAELAEQHAHLDLQVNLLTEKKTSKIIALLEALRHDMPDVHNKHDPEAKEMARAADPKAVLSALSQEKK